MSIDNNLIKNFRNASYCYICAIIVEMFRKKVLHETFTISSSLHVMDMTKKYTKLTQIEESNKKKLIRFLFRVSIGITRV